jgi:hypothetical protein
MEAGVLQEIRMTLMGHSSGSKVHSIYTHIELPAKRKAIRTLEAWVNQQQEELKKQEKNDASTENTGIESTPGSTVSNNRQAGTQSMEEENTR